MGKVLITGAGGFIGSHLTEYLIDKGHSVKAFIHYNSKNSWGWLEASAYKNEIEVVSGDIRDYDSVFRALEGCSSVFHLAALIGIPYSYISPLAYIKTNVEGTYNILEASRQLKVEDILITSTSETYGTAQYVPIDEDHPVTGQSPYSASKIAADQFAMSYYKSFGLPVKIVRPFNTYGPRQSARAIIPTVILQILSGQKRLNLGNITPTRDLVYVKDTCKGFYEIFRSGELFGKVTNIGMKEEISVENLVNKIAALMGSEIIINADEKRIRPANSEVERLYCNNSRLTSNTDWIPDYTLTKGLEETILWLKNNSSNYKAQIYNV